MTIHARQIVAGKCNTSTKFVRCTKEKSAKSPSLLLAWITHCSNEIQTSAVARIGTEKGQSGAILAVGVPFVQGT